jgi:hypothetical protein
VQEEEEAEAGLGGREEEEEKEVQEEEAEEVVSGVRLAAVALCAAGSLALAAPAIAATRYVDEDAGAGGGTCTNPSDPCDQISDATGAAVSGEVILVGADLYSESVTLGAGVSLVASNFNPAFTADNGGVSEIDGGAGNGILVTAGAAREIGGLTIQGDSDAIELQGDAASTTVSIVGNTFASRDTQFDSRIQVSDGAGAANVTIERNAWAYDVPLTTTLGRIGIDDQTTGPLNAVVRNNSFDAVASPLVFNGSDPLITGNTMTRVYEDDGGTIKRAIDLIDSSATVEGNSIAADATSGLGVIIDNDGAGVDAPVLRRNSVTGFDSDALNVRGAPGTADTVTVSDALFTITSASFPVSAQDLAGTGSLSLTGVTLSKPSGSAIYAEDTRLLLDSSILSGGIAMFGATTCTSSFSRGAATGTPGDLTDCNDFATTAAPGFAGAADFHLAAGSAMIDAGNPASSTPLDLDGDPRALSGTPGCALAVGRQDIGADEFLPATGIGCPAVAPLPKSAKKCKKKRKKKGKRGSAAAKKKKCKKKKTKKKQ